MATETMNERMTVGELVAGRPGAAIVLERLGIDYCCGGGRELGAVCAEAGTSMEAVVDMVRAEEAGRRERSESDRDWRAAPLSELIGHIVSKHHTYTKAELPRLLALVEKVYSVHGGRHPELHAVRESYRALKAELDRHLVTEEEVLFPAVERLGGSGSVDSATLSTMRELSGEHDTAGDLLRRMRRDSGNYEPPADGCGSFVALYQGLAALEADLHVHIHLENNVMFPRATRGGSHGPAGS